MKMTIKAIAFAAALGPLTCFAHTLENNFDCYINPGYTMADVVAWKNSWIKAAREMGITEEDHLGTLWVPVIAGDTSTNPVRIKYNGKFKDYPTMGGIMPKFLEGGFETSVRKIMNCKSAEQWVMVPEGGAFEHAKKNK